MLITLQIPITDVRKLVEREKVLQRPGWPSPSEREFVRYVGPIRERKAGGVEKIGECFHCIPRSGIRVDIPKFSSRTGSLHPKLREIRFFFDGAAMGKFEFAFAYRFGARQIDPDVVAQTIRDIVGCRIRVRDAEDPKKFNEATLGRSGKFLCNLVRLGTEKNDSKEFSHLIFPHRPLIHFVEDVNDEVVAPLEHRSFEAFKSIQLDFFKYEFDSGRGFQRYLPVWIQHTGVRAGKEESRKLRLSLLRLHSEYHSLRSVVELISREVVSPSPFSDESKVLQEYLRRVLTIIRADESPLSSDIVDFAKSKMSLARPGFQEDILNRLREQINIRPNLLRNLRKHMEEEKKSERPINIGFVHGPVLIDSIANESINTTISYVKREPMSNDLEQALTRLGDLIKEASELLDQKPSRDLASRYKSFAEECTQEKPDKGILEAIGNRIVEVTAGVASVAKNIATTVGAILGLIG